MVESTRCRLPICYLHLLVFLLIHHVGQLCRCLLCGGGLSKASSSSSWSAFRGGYFGSDLASGFGGGLEFLHLQVKGWGSGGGGWHLLTIGKISSIHVRLRLRILLIVHLCLRHPLLLLLVSHWIVRGIVCVLWHGWRIGKWRRWIVTLLWEANRLCKRHRCGLKSLGIPTCSRCLSGRGILSCGCLFLLGDERSRCQAHLRCLRLCQIGWGSSILLLRVVDKRLLLLLLM